MWTLRNVNSRLISEFVYGSVFRSRAKSTFLSSTKKHRIQWYHLIVSHVLAKKRTNSRAIKLNASLENLKQLKIMTVIISLLPCDQLWSNNQLQVLLRQQVSFLWLGRHPCEKESDTCLLFHESHSFS